MIRTALCTTCGGRRRLSAQTFPFYLVTFPARISQLSLEQAGYDSIHYSFPGCTSTQLSLAAPFLKNSERSTTSGNLVPKEDSDTGNICRRAVAGKQSRTQAGKATDQWWNTCLAHRRHANSIPGMTSLTFSRNGKVLSVATNLLISRKLLKIVPGIFCMPVPSTSQRFSAGWRCERS